MYYIAGITKDGIEMGCDFGFAMIERIILDDIFMEIPFKVMDDLIAGKRFSYFGEWPGINAADLVGQKAQRLQAKYGIDVLRENCRAVIVERASLMVTLKRIHIKLWNLSSWQGGLYITPIGLFNHIVLYHPQLLRSLLGEEKYGLWDHAQDQERALGVLNKFIDFLAGNSGLQYVVLHNELTCSHWDASGELQFDSSGRLVACNYFGQGNGHAYKYYPEPEVWQRK